jgi:hypothetical protein
MPAGGRLGDIQSSSRTFSEATARCTLMQLSRRALFLIADPHGISQINRLHEGSTQ